jgi:integrase
MSTRKRRGRGEGGIRHRKHKDLWEVTLRLGNGKRRTEYAKTKAEALEKLRRMRNESAAGIETDGGAVTLEEYLTWWLATTARRSVRHGHWVRYEQLVRLRILPHLARVRLERLTPSLVEQFLTDLQKAGVKPRGQQMAVNVLGRAMKDAVRLKRIASNPVRDVVKPQVPRPESTAYSPDEVGRFFAAASADRLFALYVLAIDTGMRSGELFALEWSPTEVDPFV